MGAMREDLHHLEKRAKRWYVTLQVPPPLRHKLGRRLRETLKTRDLATALAQRDEVLARFQAQLKSAAEGAGLDRMAQRVSEALAGTLSNITIRRHAEPSRFDEVLTTVATSGSRIRMMTGDTETAQPTVRTFREAATAYAAANKAAWSAIHARQWINTITQYVLPVIGNLHVAAIDTEHVLKILSPIWATKNETAARVRGRIEAVLDYAATRGWRSRGDNVAAWRGHLAHALPAPARVQKEEHHAALPWKDAPALWGKLTALNTAPALALRLLLLTAARTDTIRKARWSEFDLEAKVWNAPAEHMKSGKPHRYPLSSAALSVLKAAQRLREPGNDRVFPIGINAMYNTMKEHSDSTVHGLRSTFRDWVAEATNYPSELGEIALAHEVGGAVERAYMRSDMFDKRRSLAADWAKHLIGK